MFRFVSFYSFFFISSFFLLHFFSYPSTKNWDYLGFNFLLRNQTDLKIFLGFQEKVDTFKGMIFFLYCGHVGFSFISGLCSFYFENLYENGGQKARNLIPFFKGFVSLFDILLQDSGFFRFFSLFFLGLILCGFWILSIFVYKSWLFLFFFKDVLVWIWLVKIIKFGILMTKSTHLR